MKTQKGFGVVEGLLTLVIIGLIGGTGWYVWQSQKNADKSLDNAASTEITAADNKKNTSTKPETAPIANWKNYSRYGVTFKYPKNWGFKADNSSQSTSTYLTSPDFSSSPESAKGETITIDEGFFAQSGLNADNFKAKHLDSSPNPYSDFKKLTVNGEKVVQYYQGDSRTTVFFLPTNKLVTFVLDTFPNRKAMSSTYNLVIETVTIN